MAKLKVIEVMPYLLAVVIFILVVRFKFNSWLRQRAIGILCRGLYNDVVADLKAMRTGGITGLSESDILRKYLDLPLSSSDGLSRDEFSF